MEKGIDMKGALRMIKRTTMVLDNIQHFLGVCKYSNGDIYEGLFKNDKKNGKGTLKLYNGDKYVEILKMIKLKGVVSTFRIMETSMKESFLIIRRMEKVLNTHKLIRNP